MDRSPQVLGRNPLSRRSLLAGTAGALAAAGLGSCSTGGRTGEGGVQGAGLELPTYRALKAVTTDMPGDAAGVPDCFLTYPRPPVVLNKEKPGRGGTITAMLNQEVKAPAPMDRNSWWQGLNERLGTTLAMQIVPGSDYLAKLTTAVAGGDLPDVIRFPIDFPRLPDVLEATCEDLTEYFSGDAVLEHPALANLSTTSWRSMVQNGRIGGMPAQNIVGTGTWIVRGEVTSKLGISLTPGNADDVLAMAKEVTDRKSGQFAFGVPAQVLSALGCAMWNSPNNWGEVNGSFVKNEETDEFAAALEWAAKVWQSGVMHPDSFATINSPGLYQAGKIIFFNWGGIGWGQMLNKDFPDLDMQFMLTPSHAGGGPGAQRLGPGITGLVAIRKQNNPDRVREIIDVINYLASPMGSAEELYLRWGEEGKQHTWDDKLQTPVLTDTGIAEIARETAYIGCNPYIAFNPGYGEVTKKFYELEKIIIPAGRADASLGLYSSTSSTQGATLARTLTDGVNRIMQGQRPMSDLTKVLDEYRKNGGDQIRREFEEAFAKAKSGG